MISHIELRSEESIDVRAYVHKRKIDKVVVSLDGEIKEIRNAFLKVTTIIVHRRWCIQSFCFSYSDSIKDCQPAGRPQGLICH